jgi:hypothetical protein
MFFEEFKKTIRKNSPIPAKTKFFLSNFIFSSIYYKNKNLMNLK